MSRFALDTGWLPPLGETTALSRKQTRIRSQNQQKHDPRHRNAADDIRHWEVNRFKKCSRPSGLQTFQTFPYRIATQVLVNTISRKSVMRSEIHSLGIARRRSAADRSSRIISRTVCHRSRGARSSPFMIA